MKSKYLVIKCAYVFVMAFLFFIGHRTVEVSPVMRSLLDTETKKSSAWYTSDIENILDGTDVPLHPDGVGATIDYAEDLELPEDSALENWKVYEYEELPQKEEDAKRLAEETAEVLLGDYFSKATQHESYGSYCMDYSDKQRSFHFNLNLGRYSIFSFKHFSKEPEIEEPEDGDWDRAYREYSESLFQKLKLGSWDGEQAHLELETSGGNAFYVYRYVFDEKKTTDVNFASSIDTFTDTIFIQYSNGVLTDIETNNAFIFIKNVRDAKVRYSSIEKAMEDAEQKLLTSTLTGNKFSPEYAYYRINSVKLSYIKIMTGEFKKEYSLMPVLDLELTRCSYYLNEQRWNTTRSLHYGLMLESGEEKWG